MATVATFLGQPPVASAGPDPLQPSSNAAIIGRRLLLVLAVMLYAVVLVRTAWLCDDSYIALRTVDNFVAGHGLTWNVAERVQAFTCPLWVLLLSGVYYFTREPIYTTIGASLACSLAAVGLLAWCGGRRGGAAVLALTVLSCSKAFTDFSSSGLENPLTHLLLAVFLTVYFAVERASLRRLGILALLASLAAVNRLDTILFFAPPLAVAWWQNRSWRAVGVVVIGNLPLALWLAFAVFYYGFAFPNTAYAKLHAGIPASELAVQGLYYYLNSLTWDPVTLPFITLAVLLSIGAVAHPALQTAVAHGRSVVGVLVASGGWKHLAAVLGIALYLIYIVRIGGDFMSGRFFAAPLLAACMTLVASPRRWPLWLTAPLTAVTLMVGLCSEKSSLRSGRDYGIGLQINNRYVDLHGIADERGVYFPSGGLLRASDEYTDPFRSWRLWGLEDRARAAEIPVVVFGNVGIRCFHGGPEVHYVDTVGLGDPLLARLPCRDPAHARIGHFDRALPNGYVETLTSGENRLEDPRLRVYYDRLRTVIRGDLFDAKRLREVARMAKGRYQCLLDDQPCVPPVANLPRTAK